MLFAVGGCLAGSMQAASLVGKHGQEISAGASAAAGMVWILVGAGMGWASRRAFVPEDVGEDGPRWDQLLLWAPTLILIVLLWWFEVP